MPYFGLGLHIGDTEADATVGPPSPNPDLTLLTEAGDFILTEAGAYLLFNLPPLLTTEAGENLNTEDNISIST